jgi:hypothetical protein
MTNPINAVGTSRTIREPRDEKRDTPDRAVSTAKPSVADAWARYETTGEWTHASAAVPDDGCQEVGAGVYDRCMGKAKTACDMFPYMGTVAGSGVGRMAGRNGAWLGGVAGKAAGDRMKDQCLDVSDVQCRTKEAETLDVCMDTRTAPAPHYTPEDFPVAQPQDENIPNFTPEDFPLVKD